MIVAARVGLVIFAAVVIQTVFIAPLGIGAARGDVILLLAIAAGLESDAERGAIVGFAGGLTFDLLLNTPVGLSALTYCLVGYLVGTFQSSVLRSTWWIPVVATMVASALGVLLFAILDEVVGQATVDVDRLPGIVAFVAILNGVLSRPFRWVMRWALADPSSPRDHLFLR